MSVWDDAAKCDCCRKRRAKVFGELVRGWYVQMCNVCLRAIVKRGAMMLVRGDAARRKIRATLTRDTESEEKR